MGKKKLLFVVLYLYSAQREIKGKPHSRLPPPLSFSFIPLSLFFFLNYTTLNTHTHTVLVGDTSSSTLLSAYPQIATQFPNQLACIFIRNTSATDSDDKLPYNTQPFQNVSNSSYFFYNDPQDLMNLNITAGQCVNQSSQFRMHVESVYVQLAGSGVVESDCAC